MRNHRRGFLILLGLILIGWGMGWICNVRLETVRSMVSGFSPLMSSMIFLALYVGLTTLVWFGPKDVLRLGGALIFGGPMSAVLVTIGEMVNAGILFHLSRRLGRRYVDERLGPRRAAKMRVDTQDQSLLGTAAMRMNPFLPFRLLDLGFGLTSMSFRRYFLIIAVISPFRIYWLQEILAQVGGAIFTDMTALQRVLQENAALMRYTFGYLGAMVLVTILALMVRRRRRVAGDDQ